MRTSIQKRTLCIFCGGGNPSKEHFFPTWMHPLLPSNTLRGEKIIREHPVQGQSVQRDSTGNAGIHTMKIRVVCEQCNNGWMNRIEARARPHLTKIAQGMRTLLDADAQLAVAQWCAAKVMVAEHAKDVPPVTPPADRRAFAEKQIIPDYFRIYVCAHACDAQIGYTRRTSTVSMSPGGPVPELDGMPRNVQQVSFLIGRGLVHVNAARVQGLVIEDHIKFPKLYKNARLWPPTSDRLKWPGKAVLNFEEVRAISNSLKVLTRVKGIWAGERPD